RGSLAGVLGRSRRSSTAASRSRGTRGRTRRMFALARPRPALPARARPRAPGGAALAPASSRPSLGQRTGRTSLELVDRARGRGLEQRRELVGAAQCIGEPQEVLERDLAAG